MLSGSLKVSGSSDSEFGTVPAPLARLRASSTRYGRDKSGETLEIRHVGVRDREQVLAEMIPVVLGTDHLVERVRHLAPAPHHVERLVEGVRVVRFGVWNGPGSVSAFTRVFNALWP